MKNILITGGSGFVGRNVIQELHSKRPDLSIYNLSGHALGMAGVVDIVGDAVTLDPNKINIEFDYIIHLLALSNEKYCQDFEKSQKINIDFTKRMLDFARIQKKLKKFVHLSSAIIYDGTNTSPVTEDAKLFLHYTNYSFTKGVAEFYANHYRERWGVPIISFRLSNIYGPYQRFVDSPFLVPSKIVDALDGKNIEVFDLRPKRDWIYSEDAANAIVRSLDVSFNGVLNLASGKAISVEDVVGVIAKKLNVEYSSLNKKTTGPSHFYCDISKIKAVLDWHPVVNFEEGIIRTIEYIKQQRSTGV